MVVEGRRGTDGERGREREKEGGNLLVIGPPNCVPVRTYVVPSGPVPTMLPARPSSSKPKGSMDAMPCPYPPVSYKL